MSPTTQTRVTLAGVTATLLAALSLTPLVEGLGWFVAVVVVVAVVVGSGAAMRQVTRLAALVVAVQVVVLALALTALFARGSALLGVLPGPDALRALGELVDDGLRVVRQEGAPVAARPGLLLLVAGGIGAVALAVDVIAVTLRRPAVAGLPLLLVYCVPAAVLPGGLGWFYFLLGGAGYLLLVGADAGERVRAWGRVLGGAGRDGARSLGSPLSGARRIGVASLAVAVVVPAFVPGLGERLLDAGTGEGSGEGPGSGRVAVVNPILRLQQNLNARSDTVVLTYRTGVPDPDPLRIVTDDEFTGRQWQPREVTLPREQRVQNGMGSPPGLTEAVPRTTVRTTIEVGDLAQKYLPLPYPTRRVEIEGTWLWDAETLNVVGEDADTRNRSYTVEHLDVNPTPEQLDSAGPAPATVRERYTALPDNLPAEIGRIAREQAGPGSDYRKAVALQRWLRNSGEFQYSETVTTGDGTADSGQDAVLQFLTTGKAGYCVQFASAMAVMARALDIPARVAVGFLPGTRSAAGDQWSISLRDAHAWPELYFQGVGWVRFEPTPAVQAPQAPAYATAPVDDEPAASPSPSASASAAAPVRPDEQVTSDTSSSTQGGDESAFTRFWNAVPWQAVGVAALVLLLLAVPLAAALLARRGRWRRARSRSARAEAAWDELRERLGDLAVGWSASSTPRAVQERLVTGHGLDGEERAALDRLTGELEDARYAPPGGQGPGVDALRGDVRLVVQGVAAGLPAGVRRRARVLPTSGVSALTGVARRVDVAAGEAGRRVVDRASGLGLGALRTVGGGRRQ